jgi:hypothetical protein
MSEVLRISNRLPHLTDYPADYVKRLIYNIRDARLLQWVAEYIRSFLTN